MGWDGTPLYEKDSINVRRRECASQYTWEDDNRSVSVLKDAMVGTTWYGAVAITDKGTGATKVQGNVVLTSVRDGYLYLKSMSENMGPHHYDCPVGILNLLSKTDDEWAMEWRRLCRENAMKKANRNKTAKLLRDLPLGAVIATDYRGNELQLRKRMCRGLSKPVWTDERYRYRTSDVVNGFKCVVVK